jgi:hypothetical protein
MENVWRNHIGKEVHSASIFFSRELDIDTLHDLQSELERSLGHYEWSNLQRSGLIGNRRTVIGRRRFEVDEKKVLEVVQETIKEVFSRRPGSYPKPIIVAGKCRASYA